MRNDNANWNSPDLNPVVVSNDTLLVTQIQLARQLLISGANARTASKLALIGWPGAVSTDQYALVLRRDRILEVNGPHRPDGWDDINDCAVSNVSDGFSVFDISGRGSLELLKHGGFVNIHEASASVARQMFGLSVLFYRTGPAQYRLHVNRPYAQALRDHVTSRQPRDSS